MKKTLFFLRVVLLLLLFLSAFDFSLIKTSRHENPATAYVIIDSSLSMSLPSRMSRAKKFIKGMMLPKINNVKMRFFSLTDSLHETKNILLLTPSGAQTAYRAAFEKIMEASWNEHPDAVIFISDGADTQGASYDDLLKSFRESQMPFYTVYAGSMEGFPDVEVSEIQSPPTVKTGETVKILAHIIQSGFSGKKSVIEMSIHGGKTQRKIISYGDTEDVAVPFEVRAAKPGIVVGKIYALPLSGEKGTHNNEKYFSFIVQKEKWNLLLVLGSLQWEYTFLKRFLSSHPKLSVQSLWMKGTDAAEHPFIKKKLSAADIAFFADIDCVSLKKMLYVPSYTVVLAGHDMASHCGASQSALPFVFAGERHEQDVYKILPGNGLFHTGNMIISVIYPVKFKNPALSLKLEAESLDGRRFPFFAVSDSGGKKMAYVFSSSTWRWAFAKDKKQNDAYVSFWSAAIDMLLKKNVSSFEIFPERTRYTFSARAVARIVFSGDTADSPVFKAHVISPHGKRFNVAVTAEDTAASQFSAGFDAAEEGAYTVVAAGHAGDKNLGIKKTVVTVKNAPADYMHSRGNPAALNEIALLTGGKFINAGYEVLHARQVLQQLPQVVISRNEFKPLRSFMFFLLIVVLFCSDIFLRKRAGLP